VTEDQAGNYLRSALFVALVLVAWSVAVAFNETPLPINVYGGCLKHSPNGIEFVPGCRFNGMTFNSMGLQDEEHGPKSAPGVTRILLLGRGLDTQGTDNAHVAAEYLRQELRTRGETGVEIINGARIFSDVSREAEFAFGLIDKLAPDKIVFFQMNDFLQQNFCEASRLSWGEDGRIRDANLLSPYEPPPPLLSWVWPSFASQRAWHYGWSNFNAFVDLRRRAKSEAEDKELFVQPTVAALLRLQKRLKSPGDFLVVMPTRFASNSGAIPAALPIFHSLLQPFVPKVFLRGDETRALFEKAGLRVVPYKPVPDGEFASNYLTGQQGAYLTEQGRHLFAQVLAESLHAAK
jgi:hypothetical protein